MKKPTIRKELTETCGSFLSIVDELGWVPPDMPNALAATKMVKGYLTLLLPLNWDSLDLDVQKAILLHECGHWAGAIWDRLKDRTATIVDPVTGAQTSLFYLCHDATIHEVGGVDWELVDRTFGSKTATYERLGIPVMPAEFAYDLLLRQAEEEGRVIDCSGCGHHHESDNSEESQSKAMDGQLLANETMAQNGATLKANHAGDSTSPSRGAGIIPGLPAWMIEALQYMLDGGRNPMDLRRSWRRESRVSDCIPGRSRSTGKTARFLHDASGSISDEMSARFLGAVASVPELTDSDVCVFDTSVSEPIPVGDLDGVLAEIKKRGGGTAIQHAASARDTEKTNVWLTDAESGDGLPPPSEGDLWVVWGSMAAHMRALGYRVIDGHNN